MPRFLFVEFSAARFFSLPDRFGGSRGGFRLFGNLRFCRGFARKFLFEYGRPVRGSLFFETVFAVERAISAERNDPYGENFVRLLVFMFEYRGTEPDLKLVDLEFEDFSRQPMPELVHCDHDEKDQYGEQHGADRPPNT